MASKPSPKKSPAKKAPQKKAAPPAKTAKTAKPAQKAQKAAPAKKTAKPAPKPAPKVPVKTAPKKPASPPPAKKAAPAPAKAPKPAVKAPAPAAAPPVAEKPAPAAAPAKLPADLTHLTDLDEASELDLLASAPPPRPKAAAGSSTLTISIQTSPGTAGNGNTHPANLLVIVTCAGTPVVELSKDHFTLMEHFEVPGQAAPFSNNITSFRNAGTGAYLLQIKPIMGAPWRSGQHLGQLLICDEDDRQGQSSFKLVIR